MKTALNKFIVKSLEFRDRKKALGFTLVELLVVVTIIGILLLVGITSYSGIRSKARDSQRLDDARKIILALEQYKSGAGSYPGSEGLNSVNNPTNWIPASTIDLSNFKDNKLPVDPLNVKSDAPPVRLNYYLYITKELINPTDYCLIMSLENNAQGHPYFSVASTTASPQVWFLKFGPYGAKGGFCNEITITF